MKKELVRKCLAFGSTSFMMTALFSISSCSKSGITVEQPSAKLDINGEAEFHFQIHSALNDGGFSEVTIQQNIEKEEEKLQIIVYPTFDDKSNFFMKIGLYNKKGPDQPIDIHFNLVFNWYDDSGDYKTQVVTDLIAKYEPSIIPPSIKSKVFHTEQIDDKYITSGSFNDFTIFDESIPLLDLQPHAICEDKSVGDDIYADIDGSANKFNLSISILTNDKIAAGLYPLVIWIQINEKTIFWSKNDFSFCIEG